MTIKTLAVSDRPREKLLERGAESLATSELLAILLNNSGQVGVSVLDLAQRMLGKDASLRALAAKSFRDLAAERGIGPAKAATLLAAFELAHRFEEEVHPLPTTLGSPAATAEHFYSRLRDMQSEVFFMLYLDARGRLKGKRKLFEGHLSGVTLHPRELFRAALDAHAASIVLLHNHPSGIPTPSAADYEVTSRIADAGASLGVPLLDHLIIGDHVYYSFHEHAEL